ncbi:MAG: hypothetical protein ACLU4J_13430 [Butyricimonas paravirosa]
MDNYGNGTFVLYHGCDNGRFCDYERKVSIAVVENDTNYVNTARRNNINCWKVWCLLGLSLVRFRWKFIVHRI